MGSFPHFRMPASTIIEYTSILAVTLRDTTSVTAHPWLGVIGTVTLAIIGLVQVTLLDALSPSLIKFQKVTSQQEQYVQTLERIHGLLGILITHKHIPGLGAHLEMLEYTGKIAKQVLSNF